MPQIKLTLTQSELDALPDAHNSAARGMRAFRIYYETVEHQPDADLFQPKDHGGKRKGAGRKPTKKKKKAKRDKGRGGQ